MASTQVAPLEGPAMPTSLQLRPVAPAQFIDEIIVFSPGVRLLIRSLILLLVVSNASLLALFAVVYMQNEKNGSLVWLFRIYFLYSDSNAFFMKYSTRVALGYAIVSTLFGLVALRLLWRYVPRPLKHCLSPFKLLASQTKRRKSTRRKTQVTWTTSIAHKISRPYHHWRRAVGVRGPYFELYRVTGEIFEITSQTAAAYSASQSISNVPLNIIYAVVIFLNSIGSFVFRRVFRQSLVKQRIACLLTDLVLDFVWGTLLPIWMYLPIVKIWMDQKNVLEYIETFANSTREVERVLIISWKLYALSMIPFCNSLLSMLKLHDTVKQIARARTVGASGLLQNNTPLVSNPLSNYSRGFIRVVHALLPMYGVFILIMTFTANGVFRATHHSDQYGCLHRVYPWFSTKEACLGRQINCTTLGIQGTVTELEHALDLFDQSSLADLFLLGCPGLEITPKIQSFHRLMSIVVKDSTLVKWPESAMLRHESFKELRAVQLSNVVIGYDPIGVVGVEPITPSIEWIHLQNVDGTRILNLVGDHWKGVLYFDCIGCGLTSLPEALYLMPKLNMVSLSENDLATIPESWVPQSRLHLQTIWLDSNLQLTTLPDSLWQQAATCGIFSMSWTNLSVVPDWVAEIAGPDFQLTAADTPLCADVVTLSEKLRALTVCVSPYS